MQKTQRDHGRASCRALVLAAVLLGLISHPAAAQTCPVGATGSCCEAHATPGCEDAACCDAVCAVFQDCCQNAWGPGCAQTAFDVCGELCEEEVCASATGSCCEAHATPGCEDPACCGAVCDVFQDCCENAWGPGCAQTAFDVCGEHCEDEVCAAATGSCCEAHPTAGCEDPACCDAVCDVFQDCCENAWGPGCAQTAFDVCGEHCEEEVCADATGSCCEAHPTPGCEDSACCDAVCDVFQDCCEDDWSPGCAQTAFDVCGEHCEEEVCADATGSCCEAHPTPGCEDPACCDAVCDVFQDCCRDDWSAGCALTAESVCGTVCTGACCEPTGCTQTIPGDCTTPGAFQGLGTACEPTESCCFDDGSCENLPSVCCVYEGGTATGLSQCGAAQACCFADGTCEDLAPECCEDQGGTPGAAGTTCAANCCTDLDCPPDPSTCFDSFCDLTDNVCKETFIPECRTSASKKGSVLVYPKIELKWDALGRLKQDAILTIINDFPDDVHVQWYFINGDPPLAPVLAGSPPVVIERAHRGWNWVDCQIELTENESTYWSAATGLALGCQPFTVLDPGTPPGRPDPDSPPGHRMLRGYAIAFAVDVSGEDIKWNHLSGSATLVDYSLPAAWEYGAYAFQHVATLIERVAGEPGGMLSLDGREYEFCFDKLLFDFFAVGSTAFSRPALSTTVMLDTDLTLLPLSADARQDAEGRGPITTKAKFDIWNENEDFLSGTTRCITCWDQALLSTYDPPNNFLFANMVQTHKGKARIDGIESEVCENCEFIRVCSDTLPFTCQFIEACELESENACLLGVSAKILVYSGATTGRAHAGNNLVGQGTESATILYDIREGPDTLRAPQPRHSGRPDKR